MKVTAWKTVEVECECEVEMEEILIEFGQRVDESGPDYWRRLMTAIDSMTEILARISDEVIATVRPEIRDIVRQRLSEQAARWAE